MIQIIQTMTTGLLVANSAALSGSAYRVRNVVFLVVFFVIVLNRILPIRKMKTHRTAATILLITAVSIAVTAMMFWPQIQLMFNKA